MWYCNGNFLNSGQVSLDPESFHLIIYIFYLFLVSKVATLKNIFSYILLYLQS